MPAEHDLTVKYCPHVDPALMAWCVFQDGTVVFFDALLDHALAAARQMARDAGRHAWLISGELTIPLPPLA